MGNIEQVIKSEIIRLAKKQLRATCGPLARDIRQLKRTVVELRRVVGPLKTLGAELQAQRMEEVARLQVAPEEVKVARISARLIKSLRMKLGVSQTELANLVGVSAGAVGFWEQDKARPSGHNKEALVALRKLGRRAVRKLLDQKAAVVTPPKKQEDKAERIEKLLGQLRKATDPAQKNSLRNKLRKLGHVGGLGTGRGRPRKNRK
jgi:DNA-binding transcriptional regulator YiaG